MNISDLYSKEKHESGAEMIVNGEGGKPTSLALILRGVDSDIYRESSRKMRRKVLEAVRSDKGLEDMDEVSADIDAFVDLTIGWKGTDEEFTPELCRELYTEAPYVRDQVDSFIGSRSNFMRG